MAGQRATYKFHYNDFLPKPVAANRKFTHSTIPYKLENSHSCWTHKLISDITKKWQLFQLKSKSTVTPETEIYSNQCPTPQQNYIFKPCGIQLYLKPQHRITL